MVNFLGKANPGSLKLLQTVFSFVKKFIKPLEKCHTYIKFLYWLFKCIFQRVRKEKKVRQKLKRLMDKMDGKKEIKDSEESISQRMIN